MMETIREYIITFFMCTWISLLALAIVLVSEYYFGVTIVNK